MTRGKTTRLEVECPTLEELKKSEIPEVPEDLRKVIWATYKLQRKIDLTEETYHYVDLMSIFYGVSRSNIIKNAIKRMFAEVAPEIGKERIAIYEKHLEIEKLEQLNEEEVKTEEHEKGLTARRLESYSDAHQAYSKKKEGKVWQYYPTHKLLGFKRDEKKRQELVAEREAWKRTYGSLRDPKKAKGIPVRKDP